ncbi:MAG: inositol monophosphatase family protein [Endomicrobiaceae bacterium]|nr:inositol monophosphatase family protein [Endomicrobiaceae bacterium]
MKFNKFTNTAIESAYAGSEILLKHFNKIKEIEYKGIVDPVTVADKQSQKAVIEKIQSVFPLHNIIAEEKYNFLKQDNDYCWIIDPLDGTVNYVHGVPAFCISIGLLYKKQIISGVVYAPALKEMFVAEKDKGSFLNGKKIKVSSVKEMIKALPVTGFPYYVREKHESVLNKFKNVMLETQAMRRFGSAAIDLAYVACGRFDFFWEEGLKPWDVAAGILLVEEAGGKVSDYKNKNDFLYGQTIVASNKLLHSKALKILNEK